MADFERFAYHDLYRFRAPLDPSGVNIFRATLERLDNYERLYPVRFEDIVAFARGQAHERLGDFGAAADAFREAMKADTALAPGEALAPSEALTPVEGLAPEAAESAAINRRFETIATAPDQARSLQAYLDALDARRRAFNGLAGEFEAAAAQTSAGTGEPEAADKRAAVYAFLARRQAERAEVERAETLWRNREVLPEGASMALRAWEDLLERHAASARVEKHRLRLADCYYEMAREYAQRFDPDEADFNRETFERMALAALALYRRVERAYGYPERLEARGKIDSLSAFLTRTRARSR